MEPTVAPLPDSVIRAIQDLVRRAKDSDFPMLDVTAEAVDLAASMPEASTAGVDRLRREIAAQAAKDGRVALSISRAD